MCFGKPERKIVLCHSGAFWVLVPMESVYVYEYVQSRIGIDCWPSAQRPGADYSPPHAWVAFSKYANFRRGRNMAIKVSTILNWLHAPSTNACR